MSVAEASRRRCQCGDWCPRLVLRPSWRNGRVSGRSITGRRSMGCGFRATGSDLHRIPLISDDARTRVDRHGDVWIAYVDGAEVIDCGLARRFDSEIEAVRAALGKLR